MPKTKRARPTLPSSEQHLLEKYVLGTGLGGPRERKHCQSIIHLQLSSRSSFQLGIICLLLISAHRRAGETGEVSYCSSIYESPYSTSILQHKSHRMYKGQGNSGKEEMRVKAPQKQTLDEDERQAKNSLHPWVPLDGCSTHQLYTGLQGQLEKGPASESQA